MPMDEETAAQKFNKKAQGIGRGSNRILENKIFDKILRKDKNWSHQGKFNLHQHITQDTHLDQYQDEVNDGDSSDNDDMMY